MAINSKIVVVLDGHHAQFLEAKGLKISNKLKEVEWDENLHAHRRQEKHQGYFHRNSSPGHFFDPRHNVEALEKEEFAKIVADELEKLLQNNKHELIVIAEPKILGFFRQKLHENTKKLISKEISKDLVHADINKIEEIAFS